MIRKAMFVLLLMANVVPSVVVGATMGKAEVSAEINVKSAPAGGKAVIAVIVDVPAGLHSQSHTPSAPNYIPFKVTMDANPAVVWSEPVYPPGKDQNYKGLGALNVYTGRAIVYVPVQIQANAPSGALKLTGKVQYQLCDDNACYPPQRPKIEIGLNVGGAEANASAVFDGYRAGPAEAAVSAGVAKKTDWTIWSALGAALVAGLLFNVMPCVLPVLPLKAVGFYEASQHNRAKSLALGFVFSLGLIAVFAVLAVAVLVLRVITWGELISKGWFVWTIVVVLIALGMGLLGAWNFSLPMGVYSFEPRHDTFGGNFFWGALTAILATPCTAPLLPPVLAWAVLQSKVIGVATMLTVGVGMALPYLILSAFPEVARRFPRTGPWTELFKQMMGFLLLASATYFGAGRLIHSVNFWWVVVAVVAVGSVFLVARSAQLSKNARPVGIAATLAVLLFGSVLAWTVQITGIASAGGGAAVDAAWQPYSDETFKSLRDAGQPVLVKFTANWCGSCQYIEGTVFRDAKVWDALKQHHVTALKVDFSDDSEAAGKQLLVSINPSGGIPVTAIYGAGKGPPIVLSSVYSSGELLTALDQLPAR